MATDSLKRWLQNNAAQIIMPQPGGLWAASLTPDWSPQKTVIPEERVDYIMYNPYTGGLYANRSEPWRSFSMNNIPPEQLGKYIGESNAREILKGIDIAGTRELRNLFNQISIAEKKMPYYSNEEDSGTWTKEERKAVEEYDRIDKLFNQKIKDLGLSQNEQEEKQTGRPTWSKSIIYRPSGGVKISGLLVGKPLIDPEVERNLRAF